jgi:UDP-glucose 4-epimerase
MNILVTGGAGFIGSNIVLGLVAAGHRSIVVLDDLTTGSEANLAACREEVVLRRGDVRDAGLVHDLVMQADAVFHLAARVGNVRSLEAPVEDAEVNVIGTRNVLHAARKRPNLRIVFSSSAAIFGESRYVPVDENHPTSPDSPYGVSKLAGELDVLCYAKAFGLRAVCLRYFNVYGRHQIFDAYGNVIPIFVERLLRGEELVIYGDGEQTRDFVDVQDVVAANIAALAAEQTGAFNIGTGKPTTVNELARTLEVCLGRKLDVRREPPRSGEVRHSHASIDRARAVLGYRPRVELEHGLRNYLEWYAGAKRVRRI